MSEQKYYVKFKPNFLVSDGFKWLDRDYEFSPACWRHNYTKSELEKIFDGALYKRADYCEFMELPPDWVMNDKTDKWLCEWINPLIELVPVEDNE